MIKVLVVAAFFLASCGPDDVTAQKHPWLGKPQVAAKQLYDHVERDVANGAKYVETQSNSAYDHAENEISECLMEDGCSLRGKKGTSGIDGSQGETGETGAEGAQGAAGAAGSNGAAGADGADGESGAQGETGEQGSQGEQGEAGADGQDGQDGADGADGSDGLDGEDGEDGSDGTDGIDAVVEIIDPCGNNPRKFDEVIMRMASGDLISYFEDGGKRFLAVLTPGSYRTTDAQRCHFRVTRDMRVVWDED